MLPAWPLYLRLAPPQTRCAGKGKTRAVELLPRSS